MSTWHQRKAGALKPRNKWTIVSDPPGEVMALTVFESEEAARACMARWQEASQTHLYLSAPYDARGVGTAKRF
jgi:hypothetical protein